MVPIHLEVLRNSYQSRNDVFSVGALNEKGMKLDLLSNRPGLRDGNDAFPISTGNPWMFVLHILLDGQEERSHISHRVGHGHVAPKNGSL